MQDIDSIKADFKRFVYVIWKHLGLPDPTPVQYDIADRLQHGVEVDPQRIIEAFRGVGKSWITSCYVLWLLLRNPEERFLVVSASKGRADAFSTFTKRLIYEVPILNHLKPDKLRGQRDSNIAFDVGPSSPAHAPSVKSVGVFGQLTGSRATRIIADDVEVPSNALSLPMRERLWETVKEFDSIIQTDHDWEITYLGTPQVEDTLYNELRDKRGYHMYVWPARVPGESKVGGYHGYLADFVQAMVDAGTPEGTPVDPDRFNEKDLLRREGSLGRTTFTLQFMLDPSLQDADRFPLKLSDLIVMDLDKDAAPGKIVYRNSAELERSDLPNVGLTGDRLHGPLSTSGDLYPYTGCAMHIDPSGRGADEATYCVTKMLHGYVFLVDVGGFGGDGGSGFSDVVIRKLAMKAKEWNANVIEIESNFGDGMFTALMRPVLAKIHPCKLEEVRHHTQKERRICDTLEPLMNSHRLVVSPTVIKDDYNKYENDSKFQLFFQMTRISREKGSLAKDDKIDVLAMAGAYWIGQLGVDVDEQDDASRADHLLNQMDDFFAFIGITNSNHNSRGSFTTGRAGGKNSFLKLPGR